MGSIFRIGTAVVLGIVLVGGAFSLRNADIQASTASAEVVVGTFTREYHETKDSDGDGIRDWEEELRGTNPFLADVAGTTTTKKLGGVVGGSEYVPPETVTGRFARSFLESYVRTGGGQLLSDVQKASFVNGAVSSLVREAEGTVYTRANVVVGTEFGLAPVREYGNTVGLLLVSGLESHQNALLILHEALQTNNRETLAKLAPVERAYRTMLGQLLRVPAPPSLLKEHLDLVNVVSAMADDAAGMQEAFDDPLRALVDAKEYQSDFESLPVAIDNIRRALESNGIVYANDEWGMFFFSLRP